MQFNRGDIIRNKGSETSYVVVGVRNGEVIAARLVDVCNPSEWESVTPHLPSDAEQQMRGDLRSLVNYIDSLLRWVKPTLEPGSNLDEICKRWRN